MGCPHHCIFCNQQQISGVSGLPDKTEICAIVEKFLAFKKNRFPVEVSFFGGSFLGLAPDKILELLDAVMLFFDAGKINGIRFSTRPETVDEGRLRLLRPYPVSTVELGVQSMNNSVLRRACRGHTSQDTVQAVSLLKRENCRIGLQMMTGLPGDDDATCLETARRIIALKPDMVRIYPTLVLSGSPLAVLYAKGKYQPQSLEKCVALLKHLFLLFQENRITVIRMGLQASEGLDDPATVLAGPYHPALGHLVFSKIFLDRAVEHIKKNITSKNVPAPAAVTLIVHPQSLSRMQGQNKSNISILKQQFNIRQLDLKTDAALDRDAVVVA